MPLPITAQAEGLPRIDPGAERAVAVGQLQDFVEHLLEASKSAVQR